ncbi:MAG: hypothetical protein KDJ52_11500 [Anaerolineae bacterium]|nr:hypothetical protein [Anaerolineae bacterium]
MALNGTRTYVGFGFGAIQAGLFLYEAYQSGAFQRLVVAEIMPEVVDHIRQADSHYALNIARPDGVWSVTIGPIEIENPNSDADRDRLIDAVAEAHEIGTAVPSPKFYITDGPKSLHRILAEGLRRKAAQDGPRCVVYAAENHHQAAQLLKEAVMEAIPSHEQDAVRSRVRFLDTVIGKMSGVITYEADIQAQRLTPLTPNESRAFLVEAFNRILITKVDFDAPQPFFQRGIAIFEEKEDLHPFEEAKLYGHNATHALAAYLGMLVGVDQISELQSVPGAMSFLRSAFLEESGQALIRKYGDRDPLFTPAGYRFYVDDLLQRMTNPYLRDTVDRVGRDPQRKLDWNDRLIGTMRLALSQGITPRRYALGSAAALIALDPTLLHQKSRAMDVLQSLWKISNPPERERTVLLSTIEESLDTLQRHQISSFTTLFEQN